MDFIRNLILKDYPGAHIVSQPSKKLLSGELEVTVNGQLVHSKLKGDGVVDKKNAEAFMAKVRKVAN